jgi:hypothetical protein
LSQIKVIRVAPRTTKTNFTNWYLPRPNSFTITSDEATYTKDPAEIPMKIARTIGDASPRQIPIITPRGAVIAKIKRRKAIIPNEKPERERVPPREMTDDPL